MLKEFAGMTGDLIERRTASSLGPGLPPPEQLPLLRTPGTGRGRVGRAVMAWLSPVEGLASGSSLCRRIPVSPGVEVLMDEQHPALRLNSDPTVIAEAIRHALTGIVGLEPMTAPVDLEPHAESWAAASGPGAGDLLEASHLSTETPG